MHPFPPLRAGLAALIGALLLTACSFSDSSRSSSASSGSSSKSIGSLSASSSPERGVSKDKAPYRDDVANLTFSLAGTGISAAEFPKALARTANKYRIGNWAGEKATFYGIGKGLRKAGIAEDAIARQGFLSQVLAANKDALQLIQDGYQQ